MAPTQYMKGSANDWTAVKTDQECLLRILEDLQMNFLIPRADKHCSIPKLVGRQKGDRGQRTQERSFTLMLWDRVRGKSGKRKKMKLELNKEQLEHMLGETQID